MYKKILLNIIDNISSWQELEHKIKSSHNKEKKIDSEKLFALFSKNYFNFDPSKKPIYRNVWLYEEIPADIIKKLNLKSIKDIPFFLLEDKKGVFSLVICVFENSSLLNELEKLTQEVKDIKEFILFTNLTDVKQSNFIIEDKKVLDDTKKVTFSAIKNALKADPESYENKYSKYFDIFKYSKKALTLVWETNKNLTLVFGSLTIIAGLLPAGVAYTGKLIIDSILYSLQTKSSGDQLTVMKFLGLELVVILVLEACRRGINISQSLLRILLGQKVNALILEKALQLNLSHFENSEFYDKMTRARREASTRPLSLVNRTFNLIQGCVSLLSYAGLLLSFSFLAVIGLVIASIPSFIAETKFANQAFRLFNWRSPETREQFYLETLISREDYAKEIKLYQLGNTMLDRYKNIFERLYKEDRVLTIKRGIWSYLLGQISTIAFYLAYAWIAYEAVIGKISIGDMTMYLTVFRQGQSTLSSTLGSIGGMYEDNLYLSNLYEFLDQEVEDHGGEIATADNKTGVVFENVSFSYPGSTKFALQNINLQVRKGEKLAIVGGNGSGKTTLIKLLTRLYTPDSGRILLDGIDLQEWDMDALHKRIGVIFQDFIRYQFTVGENIGVGDVKNMEDEKSWANSAEKGMALDFIKDLPANFKTQLGTWFKGGQELSLGQWQKIALSRSFMRKDADILVLDEPTSAMDAEAEVKIFEHFKSVTKNQMVFLISHRFSTVRMADKIVVMDNSKILEYGTHKELLSLNGRYATLFNLQAQGYK